jgi:lysozyme
MNQTINQAGLHLIELFEGLRLKCRRLDDRLWAHTGCEAGPNHYAAAGPGFLQQDLRVAEGAVNRLGLTLTDNQFAALVSFTFNLGGGNLNKLMSQGLGSSTRI